MYETNKSEKKKNEFTRSFFKGKKGQADFIGNVLSILPKPILFLIFILLITFITFLLSPVFNAFGVQCLTDGAVVRTPSINIFTNLALTRSLPSIDEIGGETIDPDAGLGVCTVLLNGTRRLSSTPCNECNLIEAVVQGTGFLQPEISLEVCSGDAFRTPKANLSFLQRTVTCPISKCIVPENYFYRQSIGKFECLDDSLCSSTKLGAIRDAKILDTGAIPLYPAGKFSSAEFQSTFMWGCDEKLRVEPTIKGIAIFRTSYWAIIILILLLMWGVMKFGVHK